MADLDPEHHDEWIGDTVSYLSDLLSVSSTATFLDNEFAIPLYELLQSPPLLTHKQWCVVVEEALPETERQLRSDLRQQRKADPTIPAAAPVIDHLCAAFLTYIIHLKQPEDKNLLLVLLLLLVDFLHDDALNVSAKTLVVAVEACVGLLQYFETHIASFLAQSPESFPSHSQLVSPTRRPPRSFAVPLEEEEEEESKSDVWLRNFCQLVRAFTWDDVFCGAITQAGGHKILHDIMGDPTVPISVRVDVAVCLAELMTVLRSVPFQCTVHHVEPLVWILRADVDEEDDDTNSVKEDDVGTPLSPPSEDPSEPLCSPLSDASGTSTSAPRSTELDDDAISGCQLISVYTSTQSSFCKENAHTFASSDIIAVLTDRLQSFHKASRPRKAHIQILLSAVANVLVDEAHRSHFPIFAVDIVLAVWREHPSHTQTSYIPYTCLQITQRLCSASHLHAALITRGLFRDLLDILSRTDSPSVSAYMRATAAKAIRRLCSTRVSSHKAAFLYTHNFADFVECLRRKAIQPKLLIHLLYTVCDLIRDRSLVASRLPVAARSGRCKSFPAQ
eukprot:NODE_107_length_2412_cov_136.647905_g86_i0.p1 GENE.NODE_107_length_2412_cov_136.647905_g86_i0~~NODE_107_length_2412_cov_136.647905_g86_i0.p1  ORF type:complete len:578 (-),score=117.11 NODE_107_length_2412_cov_136.647905_g86_i0:678-2360(-)